MIAIGRQLRAARALLGWSRAKLARAAGVHPNTVAWWESMSEIPTAPFKEPVACRSMRQALLGAGVRTVTSPRIGVELCETPITAHQHAPARAHHGVIPPPEPMDLLFATSRAVEPDKTIAPAPVKANTLCGARTRHGAPCKRKGLHSGRCRNHGGASTGPRTQQGRDRIAAAQRRRWIAWRRSRNSEVP